MATSNKYTAPKVHDDSTCIMIPTTTDDASLISPPDDQVIDLRQMSERDVKSLQKTDPFMYYSIPGVLKASLILEDVDYSNISNLSHADSWDRTSQPRLQEEAEDAIEVSRRTRVTFECHPSVILENIMDDLEQELREDQNLNFDDIIVSMLGSGSFARSQ